jgi:hypothetical protein
MGKINRNCFSIFTSNVSLAAILDKNGPKQWTFKGYDPEIAFSMKPKKIKAKTNSKKNQKSIYRALIANTGHGKNN